MVKPRRAQKTRSNKALQRSPRDRLAGQPEPRRSAGEATVDREVPLRREVGDGPEGPAVSQVEASQEPMPVSLDQARAAKAVALRTLKKVADVVGVGITRVHDDYAVKVNLGREPDPGVTLPSRIDGVPLRIEVTGSIRAR